VSRSSLWRTVGSVLLAAVLLAGAMYVRNHQVDTVAALAPIDIHGSPGAELTGRNVTGNVRSVRRAQSLAVGPHKTIGTDGTFVVVDFGATTVVAPNFVEIDMFIDGTAYTNLEIPGAYRRERVNPGVRLRATAVFEVSAQAADAAAQIRIVGSNDPRLDSRLVFDVDLAQTPRETVVRLTPTGLVP
jgi:hypothetical protein